MENKSYDAQSNSFDLQSWGMHHLAYLRKAEVDGMNGYAICSADGQVIGFAVSREKAIGAIMQHELEHIPLQ